jgi:hypothetical protein
MLAQHFHHLARGREEFVIRRGRRVPLSVGRLKERFQAVGERLIRAKDAEVPLLGVQLRNVAQETSHMRVADAAHAGGGNLDRIVAEVRHMQIAKPELAELAGTCLPPGGHRRVSGRSSPWAN